MHKRFVITTALVALMSAGAAQAADIAAEPAFSWTGFYVGVHGGFGWGETDWNSDLAGFDTQFDVDGALAGGQIGYNWQRDQIVVGVEADASWSDISGDGLDETGSCLGGNIACETEIKALGTITGRVGVAFDRTLFFVKGGAAWARAEYKMGVNDPLGIFSYEGEAEDTRWGFTVGTGFERAFTSNWSAKIEYNFIRLTDSVDFDLEPAQPFELSAEPNDMFHIVKVGVNYRF